MPTPSAKVAADLIGHGAIMGVIHVLSGPDHMSALAALTASVPPCKAFSAGVRWGVGHSTGLLLITAIFLGMGEEHVDLDTIGGYCEWIVGFLMVLLGAWTMWKAHKLRAGATPTTEGTSSSGSLTGATATRKASKASTSGKKAASGPRPPRRNRSRAQLTMSSTSTTSLSEEYQLEDDMEDGDIELGTPTGSGGNGGALPARMEEAAAVELVGVGGGSALATIFVDAAQQEDEEVGKAAALLASNESKEESLASSSSASSEAGADDEEDLEAVKGGSGSGSKAWGARVPRWLRVHKLREKLLSFAVGIVHGIAGPGGILGVLPAVQLHDWDKASLYLFTFCLVSALTMGAFAGLYGGVTHRLGLRLQNLDFYLRVFSGLLSIAVGVLWIALSATGKMEEVFGE